LFKNQRIFSRSRNSIIIIMATLKINVMSIVAIVLAVLSIVAVALYESVAGAVSSRGSQEQTYEAFLIIAILLAIVVLVVTCLDIESLTGKTFLIYAVTAVLLLIGIIVFGIELHKFSNNNNKLINTIISITGVDKQDILNKFIASTVFAGLAMLAAIVGAIAPFVCNK